MFDEKIDKSSLSLKPIPSVSVFSKIENQTIQTTENGFVSEPYKDKSLRAAHGNSPMFNIDSRFSTEINDLLIRITFYVNSSLTLLPMPFSVSQFLSLCIKQWTPIIFSVAPDPRERLCRRGY